MITSRLKHFERKLRMNETTEKTQQLLSEYFEFVHAYIDGTTSKPLSPETREVLSLEFLVFLMFKYFRYLGIQVSAERLHKEVQSVSADKKGYVELLSRVLTSSEEAKQMNDDELVAVLEKSITEAKQEILARSSSV